MANNTIQQIATNVGVTGYDNTSLLHGIAEIYGVDINKSKCLMYDILEAKGGDARNSKNYMEDFVVNCLEGLPNTNNVIQEWEGRTT